jgi:hypothetical protein
VTFFMNNIGMGLQFEKVDPLDQEAEPPATWRA